MTYKQAVAQARRRANVLSETVWVIWAGIGESYQSATDEELATFYCGTRDESIIDAVEPAGGRQE